MSKVETMRAKDKKKGSLVPRLRFPEFVGMGEWEKVDFDKIAKFLSGGTPSKDVSEYWGGDIPWISASSMHNTKIEKSDCNITKLAVSNGARIAQKGTLLLLVRGSMLHKRILLGISEVDVAFNQDVKALALNVDVTELYLMYFLMASESKLLAAVVQTGIGAGKLDTDDLNIFPIMMPSPIEQQRIADCLSSLDERITAEANKLDALKAHKSGLLKQLFPAEGKTLPALRFPEFRDAGEWEIKLLGQISENLDNKRVPITENMRIKGDIPYYGASGIVDYVKNFIFDEELLCISEDGANLIARTSPIAFFISGKSWVNNHAHVLKFSSRARQKLTEEYINFIKIEDFLTGMAQPKLNKAKLEVIPTPIPIIEKEEQKIADCLSSLDELITAQTQKIDLLKTHKKGLMQQLFPVIDEVQA